MSRRIGLFLTLVAGRAAAQAYPDCVEDRIVHRHAGAHAIFVDFSYFGTTGCWQNDCKHTDKFNAKDAGICARACTQIEDCTHWSYGEQEGTAKCFLRKSDGGREEADGFRSGSKACSPPALPDAWVAYTSVNIEPMLACDAGKSELCPDIARAMMTWKFAIAALKRATEGALDAGTMSYVTQIAGDTEAFMAQMSEENFPVVVNNNRQVFQALRGWMEGQPKANTDSNDHSLPNPMRGQLCGATSCYP